MKKFLITGISFLLFSTSCSNDENELNISQKILSQKTERTYFHNSETDIFVNTKHVTDYYDGLPVKKTIYMGEDDLLVIYEYVYNEDNLLKMQWQHGPQSSQKYVYEFSYDSLKRLSAVNESLRKLSTNEILEENFTTYAYDDNQIIKTSDNPNEIVPVIYELSGDRIVKVTDNNNNTTQTINYNYEGYNIIGFNRKSNSDTFENVSYDYGNINFYVFKPLAGNYFPNRLLLDNYYINMDRTEFFAYDRYIQSMINVEQITYTIEYEFGEDSFLAKKKTNQLNYHIETIYKY